MECGTTRRGLGNHSVQESVQLGCLDPVAAVAQTRNRGCKFRLCGAAYSGLSRTQVGRGPDFKEGLEPELATGWLAFAIFVVLAATSNDASVQTLGRTWKRLHRVVYAATILTFAHWFLAAYDATVGYVLAGLLLLLQVPRVITRSKPKAERPSDTPQ